MSESYRPFIFFIRLLTVIHLCYYYRVRVPEVRIEVTENMFLELKNLVYNYNRQNDEDIADLRATDRKHHIRMNDLESQINLLKKMGAPKGDGGADLLDELSAMTEQLRKEFDDKLEALRDELLKRLEALEEESRGTDAKL